jgi:hypothetical protein
MSPSLPSVITAPLVAVPKTTIRNRRHDDSRDEDQAAHRRRTGPGGVCLRHVAGVRLPQLAAPKLSENRVAGGDGDEEGEAANMALTANR